VDRKISRQEFISLVPIDKRKEALGRFGLKADVHEKMVAQAKIGDKVFFFEAKEDFTGETPTIDHELVGAVLVSGEDWLWKL